MWRDLVLAVLDWAVFIPRSFPGLPGWEMDCTGLVCNKKRLGQKTGEEREDIRGLSAFVESEHHSSFSRKRKRLHCVGILTGVL